LPLHTEIIGAKLPTLSRTAPHFPHTEGDSRWQDTYLRVPDFF
jgi:hypothetical protein